MIVARSRKRELPAAASTIRASPDGMSSEPFNSSRARLLQENAAFAASLPPGVRVLDAGAGTHRYRHLFGHTHYESADFNEQYAPTYVCDLTQIPVPNDRYDAVVINQVLEHVPDPLAVLIELRRILRSGGRLIYTAPLFFEEHLQPYDFYRYSLRSQIPPRPPTDELRVRGYPWYTASFSKALSLNNLAHFRLGAR